MLGEINITIPKIIINLTVISKSNNTTRHHKVKPLNDLTNSIFRIASNANRLSGGRPAWPKA